MMLTYTFRYFRLFLASFVVFMSILIVGPTPTYADTYKFNPESINNTWNSISTQQQTRASNLVKELLTLGYSKESALGIVANAWQESNLTPDAVNSGSGACGYFQWLGGRANAMTSFLGKPCTEADEKDSIAYLNHELENGESKSSQYLGNLNNYWAAAEQAYLAVTGGVKPPVDKIMAIKSTEDLKNADDPFAVTWWFTVCFERCGVGEAHMERRILYAATLVEKLGDLDAARYSSDSARNEDGSDKGPRSDGKGGNYFPPADEKDLKGMEPIIEQDRGQELPSPSFNDLSVGNRITVEELAKGQEREKVNKIYDRIKTVVPFVGLLLLLYSGLLLCAVMLDLVSNGIILGGTFKMLTLGSFTFSLDSEIDRPKNTLGIVGAGVVIGVIALLGALLISGAVTNSLYHLFMWISDIF